MKGGREREKGGEEEKERGREGREEKAWRTTIIFRWRKS